MFWAVSSSSFLDSHYLLKFQSIRLLRGPLVYIYLKHSYDKNQLRSRWDVLKVDWKVWEQLRNLDTGLGWDAVKGTIAAIDDW